MVRLKAKDEVGVRRRGMVERERNKRNRFCLAQGVSR